MEFCEICNNMLYVRINANEEEEDLDEAPIEETKLVYYCKNCDESYDRINQNNCVYHVSYALDDIKRENVVNKFIVNDPTLPKAFGIKCPNDDCPAKNKKQNIVYIKNDDKNMKYIYICVECHNAGITPNTW